MIPILGRLFCAALGLFLFQLPNSIAQGHSSNSGISVVYWGSADCTWCTYWEGSLSGMESDFRASDVFQKLRYIAVKNAYLRSQYVESDFQKDGRWLWKLVVDGTFHTPRIRPAWSIFVGQRHVSSYFGTKAWKETAFPNISKLVNASSESLEKQTQVVNELAPVPIAGKTQIADADLVPYLDRAGKEAYREWVKRSPPKAFAVAIDGAWGRGKSASDALIYCERYSSEKCEVYAVDQDVVWNSASR
ncbi:MAG: hypothetical protein NTW45_09105 [Rhodocyclales bacterium]|nr:hypothetical protein [Rhodocyclales bacterium]